MVLIDEIRIQELDEIIRFKENSCVTFLRLTFLSGGIF